jgi:Ala-tRNA(Pro) deacylase
MTAGREELLAFLAKLGIEAKTHGHPPLYTVEESQALRGAIAGGHTKNLFLKDRKGRIFLLVALEDAEIDLKALPALVGCGRLSFGKAELMEDLLGVTPGSVTPFGLINDIGQRIEVLLDEEMMACPTLNFHPLRNDATTTITSTDLLRFIAACGHEARIVKAASSGPAAGDTGAVAADKDQQAL